MEIHDLITTDNEILFGQPVFTGTRVPIESLFDHLQAGISLDGFLEDFPGVTRKQAVDILKVANKILTSTNIHQLYSADF